MNGGKTTKLNLELVTRPKDKHYPTIPLKGKVVFESIRDHHKGYAIYTKAMALVEILDDPYKLSGKTKVKVRFVEEGEEMSVDIEKLGIPYFVTGYDPILQVQQKFKRIVHDYANFWHELKYKVGEYIEVKLQIDKDGNSFIRNPFL